MTRTSPGAQMDGLAATRQSIHAVAELLIAGPQKLAIDTVRLRFADGAIRPWADEFPRVTAAGLETSAGVLPLVGTIAGLARLAGIVPRTLTHVYRDGSGLGVEAELSVDPGLARTVFDTYATGSAALADFAPEDERVLWPEHFDLALTQREVNFGVVPGDEHLSTPYAYVGPWQARQGPFWNVSFGAAQPLADLGGPGAVADFFRQGCVHAAEDSPA